MKIKFKMSKQIFRDYFFITLGSAVMCLGMAMLVNVFIVPGGASGMSMALYYVFNGTLSMGVLKWLINVPLFIWGLVALGNQFGFRTFWGFTMASFFLDFFMGKVPGLSFIDVKNLSVINDLSQNDFFFLVIIAAILMGAGLGIIFKYKGTTGGSDIPAAIFQKKGISPGKMIMLVDFFVIIIASIIIHWKGLPLDRPIITLVLYALLLLFLEAKIVDMIIDGFDYARMALIITDKNIEISTRIINELSRGATAIKTRGIYRDIDREMVMTVVTLKEVTKLQELVKEEDPDAFMIINNIHEITGQGFKRRSV